MDDAEARTISWEKLVESLPVAGGEEHGAALKMQNIMRQKRARERQIKSIKLQKRNLMSLMVGNSNGFLDGDEISELADWVWEFSPRW